MKFVKVTWLDASDPQGDASWYRQSEVVKFGDEMCEVESYGFLASETQKYVTLVADVITKGTLEPTFGRLTKIPTGMVQAIETVFEESEP